MSKKITQQKAEQLFKEKKLNLLSKYEKSCKKVKIRCYCGSIFFSTPNGIFTGNTKSCGCLNRKKISERSRKDISGQKFGNLTAIQPICSNKNNSIVWLFKCDCGNIKEIPLSWVTKKNRSIKSCGCLKNKPAINWTGFGDISGTYWKNIIRSSKKTKSLYGRHKDIEFKISIQDAWNQFIKQNKKCALTGVDLKFCRTYSAVSRQDGKHEQTASLDRIDSLKGYTIDNIQWVHKIINKMKMELNEKDFVQWCQLVVQNNKLKCFEKR